MTVKDKKRKPKKPTRKPEDMAIVWQQDIPIPVIEEPDDWYTQW